MHNTFVNLAVCSVLHCLIDIQTSPSRRQPNHLNGTCLLHNQLRLPAYCQHAMLLQVGLWHEAQETLQKMQADGVQPNTVAYNALIKALGSGGQWQAVSTPVVRIYQMPTLSRPTPVCPVDGL